MIAIIDRHPPQPSRPAPIESAKQRAARQYRLLKPGELVKPQIHGGRFLWLPVLCDAGPAHDRARRIQIQGRTDIVTVRRDRVHVRDDEKPASKFDDVLNADAGQRATADAGRNRARKKVATR